MIPLEDFFRKPERAGVRLSPNGARIAWLAPVTFETETGSVRRMNLFVAELGAAVDSFDPASALQRTAISARDIGGYTFIDDDNLMYVMDQDGDENWHLFVVGAEEGEPRDLTPFDGVQCSIVDDLEDEPGEILFQMNKRDPERFDVYRLDLASGDMEVVAENPGNVQSWITDHDGYVRLATTTDGVNTSILYRATELNEFRVIGTYDFKESVTPLGFTFDNQNLWVASNVGRERSAIFEMDPDAGRVGKLIFEHDEVDVSHLLRSKKRRVTCGVAFETDKTHKVFWDARREALESFMNAELPGHENNLSSFAKSEERYIVHSASDRTLGRYLLLDAPFDPKNPGSTAGFRLVPLFDLAPWLNADELAPMQPIRYTARDGRVIPGYLTVPKDHDGGALPLIVHPHGGPWVRDSWGFNPEIQFLANRGYAVLQMNYRGSTGYGRDHLESSYGQWGLAMQDDITDGVHWAIAEGLADPKRVAIYGGSYGGYATLAGITKTPELYCCAVDFVGVSNLFTWIEAFPPYWRPFLEMVYEMVGHPERDKARFEATSPIFHIDKIQCPLFVAQGANDPRVKQEESEQIVASLREKNIPVEYLLKANEGHGFRNEENRFEFYHAMEAFFVKHLAPA
jgi:dipeptidyl aminopeptidase/acylaminoacyl peptidase